MQSVYEIGISQTSEIYSLCRGTQHQWLAVAAMHRAVLLIQLKALEEEEAQPNLIPSIRGCSAI